MAPASPIVTYDEEGLLEIRERMARLETDRRWLRLALLGLLIAGSLGTWTFLWMSDQRAERFDFEMTRLDDRIRALDRDVVELLTTILEEGDLETADARTDPTGRRPDDGAMDVPAAAAPTGPASAATWAAAFAEPIQSGTLDERERRSLLRHWESLDADLRKRILKVLGLKYGISRRDFVGTLRANGAPG